MADVWTIKARRGANDAGFAAWPHGRIVVYGSTVEHVWAWLASRGASPQEIRVPKEVAA